MTRLVLSLETSFVLPLARANFEVRGRNQAATGTVLHTRGAHEHLRNVVCIGFEQQVPSDTSINPVPSVRIGFYGNC